jgi:Cys-rich protein (TIGR01571 family)
MAKKKKEEEKKTSTTPAKPPPEWMVGTKPWDVKLTGITEGPDTGTICCIAYCPMFPCLVGEAMTVSGLGGWYPCCVAQCFAPCCTQMMIRKKVADKYKMQEPGWKTYCIGFCCCPCSMTQTVSQVRVLQTRDAASRPTCGMRGGMRTSYALTCVTPSATMLAGQRRGSLVPACPRHQCHA